MRVHQIFNRADLLRLHRLKMREVEAQRFVVDQGAFLRNVRTENLTQRRVHQVRRGVVQADTLAASLIHICLYGVADLQRTAIQFTNMTNCLTVFLCIADLEGETGALQLAFIPHLAAGFSVERRLVEDHYGFLTGVHRIYRFTIDKQGSHFAVQFQAVIAFKLRGAVNADHRVVVRAKTAGFARATALLFHCGFKAGFVNLDVAFAANVGGQVNRETVGIVQAESGFAVQRVAL